MYLYIQGLLVYVSVLPDNAGDTVQTRALKILSKNIVMAIFRKDISIHFNYYFLNLLSLFRLS